MKSHANKITFGEFKPGDIPEHEEAEVFFKGVSEGFIRLTLAFNTSELEGPVGPDTEAHPIGFDVVFGEEEDRQSFGLNYDWSGSLDDCLKAAKHYAREVVRLGLDEDEQVEAAERVRELYGVSC